MTTKVEYEASYRAAVELGDPLAPKTLHAVLEAAEGARGIEHTALVDGLRGVARQLSHTARDWSSLQAADAEKMVMSAAHAVQEASDRLARLSSDVRPAPMPEEVERALAMLRARTVRRTVASGGNLFVEEQPDAMLVGAGDTLSAHIDHLTRKVADLDAKCLSTTVALSKAEAERDEWKETAYWAQKRASAAQATIDELMRERAQSLGLAVKKIDELEADYEGSLSRPQETDAVLAEREACAQTCERLWREATNFRTESALTSYVQNQIGPGCVAAAAAIRSRSDT